ncbi:MAG: hypothetical protein QOH33_1668 [Paraburkholderia sp.]|nr:hypothetical protein [Paraburkholderia sp.]
MAAAGIRQRGEHKLNNRLIRIAQTAAGVAFVIAYQFGAHYAVSTPGLQLVGLVLALAPLLALTLGAAVRSDRRASWLPLWLASCLLLWAIRAPLAQHFQWALYLEHVSFHLAMATLFGRTLVAGHEPLCSRFAAMVHGTLTPAVATYTRRITAAWALFFVAIALVSTLLFAAASVVVWSTFANYLMLPVVAMMFIAEFMYRRIVLPDEPRAGVLVEIRAYRLAMRERGVQAR